MATRYYYFTYLRFAFLLLLGNVFTTSRVSAQETATITGKIISSADSSWISDVLISYDKGQPVYSEEDGSFAIPIPANQQVTLLFVHPGFKQRTYSVSLAAGESKAVTIRLQNKDQVIQGVVITDEQRTKSLMSIPTKVINTIPSASGDINTVLFSQPGVTSRNELSSAYSVRGGNFDENLVYVNDIEVYRPFLVRAGQQEGLSFANADMVSSILFSAGGFEARYGDKMSSVLDITYRKPVKFAGTATGSLLGGNLHLEGASKDKRFTWITGIRQKSNQYVLSRLDTKGEYRPSFTDFQTFLTYDITDKWELNVLGNFSRNLYRVVPQNRETEFGTVNQAYKLRVFFDGQEVDRFRTLTGAVSANYHPNDSSLYKIIASSYSTSESETFDIQGQYFIDELETDLGKDNFGQSKNTIGVGTFLNHARNYLDAQVYSLEHKAKLSFKKSECWWGVKAQHERIEDKLKEWEIIDSSGFTLPVTTGNNIQVSNLIQVLNQVNSQRFSAYGQYARHFLFKDTSDLTITAGLRSNYWTLNSQNVISPRVTLAYKPYIKTDILFKASAGYYYQPPFYREMRNLKGQVNRNLKAQQSIHFVIGTDLNFIAWKRPFKFISEVYYKQLNDLVPYEIDNVRIRYLATNNAVGYSRGIDLKVNGEFVKGIDSWASLSILQTQENLLDDFYYIYLNSEGDTIKPGFTTNNIPTDSIRVEPGYIPRPTDQRVTFSLFFQDYLPKFPEFKMHLNLLFSTAIPFGPPGFERYKDILRSTPYRRVDIGFSYMLLKENRELTPGKWMNVLKSAWLSFEVFNLLQVDNTISYTWIKDISNRQYAIPNYLTQRQLNLKLIVKF